MSSAITKMDNTHAATGASGSERRELASERTTAVQVPCAAESERM